jgi:hypothetical protein
MIIAVIINKTVSNTLSFTFSLDAKISSAERVSTFSSSSVSPLAAAAILTAPFTNT